MIKCNCGLIKTEDNISLFPKYGNLCKVCNRERLRVYYINNKEKIATRKRNHYLLNKIPYHEQSNEYKEKRNYQCNKTKRKRRDNDSLYKFRENIRGCIGRVFRDKGISKSSKAFDILGCDFKFFKSYIESQFEPWMTWDNYGLPKGNTIVPNKTWDLDHKIPLSTAKDELDAIKLNHYTNFQPLCSYINRCVKKNNLNYF